jgi:hypothetical protein
MLRITATAALIAALQAGQGQLITGYRLQPPQATTAAEAVDCRLFRRVAS